MKKIETKNNDIIMIEDKKGFRHFFKANEVEIKIIPCENFIQVLSESGLNFKIY